MLGSLPRRSNGSISYANLEKPLNKTVTSRSSLAMPFLAMAMGFALFVQGFQRVLERMTWNTDLVQVEQQPVDQCRGDVGTCTRFAPVNAEACTHESLGSMELHRAPLLAGECEHATGRQDLSTTAAMFHGMDWWLMEMRTLSSLSKRTRD